MNNPWEQSESNGQNIYQAEPPVGDSVSAYSTHNAVAAVEHAPAKAVSVPVPPSPQAPEDAGAGNIDKIRDILFGGHMRDYDSRFARLEQNLQKESAELRDSTRKLMERLEAHFKQELEALHVRFKNERDERSGALTGMSREMKEIHEGLSKRIAEVDDHASGAHHELREQLLQHGRDVGEQLDAKHREVSALLEQRFHELRKDKTDRAALATLFNEMALRINHELHVPGMDR